MTVRHLPGEAARASWLRLDTAEILKRFFFCERSLMISQSGWLAALAPFELKITLPRFTWQTALTANALRERVLELRYPNRLLEVGGDAPLINVFDEARHAPGAEAFVLALAGVLLPSVLAAYQEYLAKADELADGPTLRFMRMAVDEKTEQMAVLTRFAQQLLGAAPERRAEAVAWASALNQWILEVGGLSLQRPRVPASPIELPARRAFRLAEAAVRDDRFHLCRYYWPDIVDPAFTYGEGLTLQLRSAVSHFNEVWAVETGGAILHAFADDLPWEFLFDAARWTYDEARHARMGYERLRLWGFEPGDLPLGSYIYDSAAGEEPVIRLGMLHYFETKNIGKKARRADAFAQYHDRLSQHDMEFDWADETIHAHYGRHWLSALRAKYPDRIPDLDAVRERCDQLVAAQVAQATDADRAETLRVAEAMLAKAERRSLPAQ